LEEIDAGSIGNGVYGKCYLRKFKRLGINVVQKQLIDSNIDMLYKEASFMQQFSHRCIPLLLGIQLEKKPVSLIMEFIGENSKSITVFKLLFDPHCEHLASEMSTETWLCICYDITDALDHMHQRGYLHCDLKTNNVLVAQNKGFLIDFGKVCEISRPKAKKYKEVYKHIAPEVLKGFPVTPASDIYSLGRVLKAIAKKTNSTILLQLGTAATDLNPKQRPSLLKILTSLKAQNIHN
jgi:serine/threonine protein kinase